MGKLIIFILAGIAGIAVIAFIVAKRKKASNSATTIYGEVIDIFKDESGLACITVKDHKKNVMTGVSNLSVNELELLYKGKGFVQVPVIRKL